MVIGGKIWGLLTFLFITKVYSIQHYVIKFIDTMISSTNKTDCHDITESVESGIKHHNPPPPFMMLLKFDLLVMQHCIPNLLIADLFLGPIYVNL
jgi:hypothetical protein